MRQFTLYGFWVSCAIASLVLSPGCATSSGSSGGEQAVVVSGVQNLDLDEQSPIQTVGVNTGDIEPMAQQMVRSILSSQAVMNAAPASSGPVQVRSVPRIALRPILNNSSERLDPQIITALIRNELIQKSNGQLDFIYRVQEVEANTIDRAIEHEERLRNEGIVDAGPDRMQKTSDLFLHGEIREIQTVTPGGRDQQLRFFFYITDTETSSMLWADDYPIRRAALLSTSYRGVDR